MRSRGSLIVSLVLFAAVALFVVIAGKAHTAGRPAPALPSQALTGPPVDLAALRGRPALIHFWASWCAPCRREAPQVARLASELHGAARLVGVDWSDSRGAALRFVSEHRWTFPVLSDSSGEVGDAYGVVGLPTTVLLDRSGRIVRRLTGPQTAASLLSLVHG